MNDYVAKSVFLLKQVQLIMQASNKHLAVLAANGDIMSSSVLLNQNVILASLEKLLEHPEAQVASTEVDELFPEVNVEELN